MKIDNSGTGNKRCMDIKRRAYYFSLDVIDLLELLPKNYIFEILGKQLLRSSTSIGANIIEA